MKRGVMLMIAMLVAGSFSFAAATAQRPPATATATIEVYKSPT